MSEEGLCFLASEAEAAQDALHRLRARYGATPRAQARAVVALGGDGFILETLRGILGENIPVYGMNRGSIGFLMNEYREDDLPARIAAAIETRISPLEMQVETVDGGHSEALAINEVSLLRETRQAAKLRIHIDGQARLEELICDGALVATPAGSTAYNLSANGPILPIDADLLALTPISAFRPRRWRGALLPGHARVMFEVLEPRKRPVSAVADTIEARDVARVAVAVRRDISFRLLFDPGHSLDERIIREQFLA